jgi:hypothetical protein
VPSNPDWQRARIVPVHGISWGKSDETAIEWRKKMERNVIRVRPIIGREMLLNYYSDVRDSYVAAGCTPDAKFYIIHPEDSVPPFGMLCECQIIVCEHEVLTD